MPSIGYESTTHRVLAIPELLQIIFSFGTRASNASNALVCRTWREVALDHLWRDVDDIYHLLQLLAPLHRRGEHEYYKFRRTPTPSDWAHFVPYARRVRSLDFGANSSEKARSLADSVFDDIARTRTTLEILPNLRRLRWDTASISQHAILFMHDKVTEFAFNLEHDNARSLAADVIGRMPSLLSLKCACTDGYRDLDYDQSLQQLLSSLRKIQEITLPKDALDGQVLKTLSLLPDLKIVRFDNLGGVRCPITPTMGCTPEEGAFPMLYDLCLHSTLEDIRLYLTGGVLLPRLKNLSVESVYPENPFAVQEFLADVTRYYPTLEVFAMDIIVSIEEQTACQSLLLEHFHPILSLKQLVRLELRHNLPLQISDVDLSEFGAALPAIEFLVLNPEPLLLTKPGFTLHSLFSISQNFPNLFHLGIYLDADGVGAYQSQGQFLAKTRVFQCLRVLNIGVSPIGLDQVPVALFLSHLFSDNERVVIHSGVSWSTELYKRSSEYRITVRERCRRWGEVTKTLPLLLQLRKEEKVHRRDIEKEVEDLRMRNEVLMGNIQMTVDTKPTTVVYDKGCTVC
ncbi:hypothetical protein B0F90DRAFT_937221 [Multifurca ochricompacta]|uniref:F-box domain-containing protein n=1 Tax=Multifurca ochricompacta TaxID=376703 RepID=A0AAD4QPR5_9AGAM|nr:hypothetical protein B0F90DRAFT_937221 [Multifurca ochricompacta]